MRYSRIVAAVLLFTPAVASMQSPGGASLSFTRTDYYVGGANGSAVAIADFDLDGRMDLAVANAWPPNTSVLLGNGDGTFRPRADYPALLAGQQLAVGDFNGDGRADIASGNYWLHKIQVGLANTDGTFGPTSGEVELPGAPSAIATGDFNHDRMLDLVIACRGDEYGGDRLSLLLGNGDGTFQPRDDYASGTSVPISLAVGDFNDDGNLDAVVANYLPHSQYALSMFLGNGDGRLRPSYGVKPGYSFPNAVATGDVNEDGHLDLIVACKDQVPSSPLPISILLGIGDGTFQPSTDVATAPSADSAWIDQIVVGDLNGDGHPDLVFTNRHANLVSALSGNGDGTFANQVDFEAGLHPLYTAMADLNGDGEMDFVVSNGDATAGHNEATVSVFGDFSSDTTAPVITVPGPVTVEATSPAGAVAEWSAPTATDETDGTVPVTCSPESGETFPMGSNTVTCQAVDVAGNAATATFTVTVRDATPPTITISEPTARTFLLGQVAPSSYDCADLASGVASCVGTVANGSPIDTSTVGAHAFSVTATDAVGNTTTSTVTYTVAYGQCVLFDQTVAHKAGSTIPIKLQLCDAAGANVSSAAVSVVARAVHLVSTSAPGPLADSGSANPDDQFRFVGDGYIFNLSLKGFTVGTYAMVFKAGTDPTEHIVEFQVR